MRIERDTATVRVAATSGNLGPGFDTLGMAHGIYDEVSATLVAGPSTVTITGHGAGELPLDESHLIIRALRRGLEVAGVAQAGVRLTATNGIAQSRGLGSSAAAVVAGLALAGAMINRPREFGRAEILRFATEFEGHPDNAAPAVYGGAVVSWISGGTARARNIPLHPDLATTLLVPTEILPTTQARAALPSTVAHTDAAFNASRAALLVYALSQDPSLLMDATEDRLHQDYRAGAMPATADVLQALREAGWPAVVSGAGPAILVFDTLDEQTRKILASRGFEAIDAGIGEGVTIVDKD